MCVCRANKSDLSACLPTRCGCRKHGRECRCSSCCCQCKKIEVSKPRFYTKLVRAHADWPTIAFEAHLCIAHSTMACSFYYVAHQPSSFGQCCCWLSVQRHVVAICVLYIYYIYMATGHDGRVREIVLENGITPSQYPHIPHMAV